MTGEVLPFKKKASSKWCPVLDTKGGRLLGYFYYVPTGEIYYRQKFAKLGIPPIQFNTRCKTLGKAKTAVEIEINRHKNRHLGIDDSATYGKRAGKRFETIAREVLEKVTPKRRPTTQVNHRIYIGKLIEAFGDYDVNALSAERFDSWIEKQKETQNRQTFMDFAKNMNLVMRYAYNRRYCTHLIRFQNPDQAREKTGRVYTDTEVMHLWQVMGDETKDQFSLCYECMMRLREALYLTWDRIDLKTGKITLRAKDVKTGSKTGKGREFFLSPGALARMRARHKKRDKESPFVFPSPGDKQKPVHQNKTAWTEAKRKAKIKGKARWHDLRHSALSKALLELKLDPVSVSEYAGVSLRTIQAVYLHSKAEHTRQVSGSIVIKTV